MLKLANFPNGMIKCDIRLGNIEHLNLVAERKLKRRYKITICTLNVLCNAKEQQNQNEIYGVTTHTDANRY